MHGSVDTGNGVVTLGWINPDGEMRSDEDWWFGHAFGAWIAERNGKAYRSAVALCFNAWDGDLPFQLPQLKGSLAWQVRFCSASQAAGISSDAVFVPGNSIAIVVAGPG